MTLIKYAPRSATISLCPAIPLLAAGTVAGAVDSSFSTNSKLEFFTLDYTSPSPELPLAGGSVSTPEPLNRLAWTSFGNDQTFPYGIVAGGLADGTICLWDPAKVVGTPADNEDVQGALLAKLNKHTGEVAGLEFNYQSHNLLASGGADAEICIWDVSKPTQPSLYPAMRAGGAEANQVVQPGTEVTHLSWNVKVQHILGSCTTSGTVVVWDLKKQRPVMSFRDSYRRRASWIQWNPEVATQLVVASDDDNNPIISLWDLRNSSSPFKQLHSHTKGVLSLSWCKQDPRLLLSSGKDNRILCWDVHTSTTQHPDILADIPTENWAFNVEWSLRTPGVFASANYDGKVGVSSFTSFAKSQPTPTGVPQHTPAWLKRPVSAAFGFNGTLATVINTTHTVGQQTVDTGTISITQVVTENELVEQSQEFDSLVRDMDRDKLRDVCEKKAEAAAGEETETWQFLKVLFEDDARRQLLSQLGFTDMLPNPTAEVDAATDPLAAAASLNNVGAATLPDLGAMQISPDDFFDQDHDEVFLGETTSANSETTTGNGADAPAGTPKHAASGEGEAQIERALVVGNYAAAVEECFKVGRMADALLIATIGGEDLWRKAQQLYMTQQPRPYMKLLQAVLESNLEALIRTRPVSEWRETLAILATYATSSDWTQLCNTLGLHLAAGGMYHAATLCYICAGNVDEAVTQWAAEIKASNVSVKGLQSLMEKAVVLGIASGSDKASPALSDLVNRYVSILASQGQVAMAWEYLALVPGEVSTGTAILKDRLYRSGAAHLPATAPAPPFPFQATQVIASAQPAVQDYGSAYAQSYDQSYQAPATPGYYNQPPQPAAVHQAPVYSPPAAPATYQPAPAATYQPAPAATYQPAPTATYQPAPPVVHQTYNQPAAMAPPPFPVAGPPSGPPVVPARASAVVEPPKVFQPPANVTAVPPMGRHSSVAPPTQPLSQRGSGPLQQPNVQLTAPPPQALGAVPSPAPMQPPPAVMQPPPTVMQPPAAVAVPPAVQAQPPGVFTPGVPSAPIAPQPITAPAPPQPTGPPANINIEKVDVSAVGPELKPVVTSLTNLYQMCLPIATQNASKKREMDDNSKRLGQLFWKLNAGDVSPEVISKLQQLCQALDGGDFAQASHLQINLATSNWDECSTWLSALKRLIKTRQTLR